MEVKVLVNQVGYEVDSAKRLLVQSDANIDLREFQIVAVYDETPVFSGKLEYLGEVKEWGLHYWEGNFDNLRLKGTYVAIVKYSNELAISPPFKVRENILRETINLAARFFFYQRCGMEVPGLHKPCHTDDGFLEHGGRVDVTGGWHDAGDYNKYNGYTPLATYALVYTFERVSARDLSKRVPLSRLKQRDLLDEALWGAKFLLKMQTEDGWLYGRVWSGYSYWGPPELESMPRVVMGRADISAGGFTVAAFAKLSKLLRYYQREVASLLERRALLAWSWYASEARDVISRPQYSLSDAYRLAPMVIAALALKEIGHDESLKLANSIVAKTIDSAQCYKGEKEYDKWFDPFVPVPPIFIVDMGLLPATLLLYSIDSKANLKEEARQLASGYIYNYLCKLVENPLGIPKFYVSYKGMRRIVWFLPGDYFGNWHVGPNSYYLSIAWSFLLAAKVFNDRGLTVKAIKIFDWILGVNPFGICMLEGAGTYNLPEYHHRYGGIPGNERGAVPGVIPNGICREPIEVNGKKTEGEDKPFIDLEFRGGGIAKYETNEPWLPHNAYYLLALSEL